MSNGTQVRGRVALVTGANRGIGKAIVEPLLARGAAKVYAGARNPEALAAVAVASGGRVVPLRLDVGVYPGPVDTGMAEKIPIEKVSPASVATAILDGLEAGEEDILPDPYAVEEGAVYAASPKTVER